MVERVAPGCYLIGPSPFPFLWIAANELPLAEELIPFLIARSGKALDELCLWVKARRPPEWLLRMIELLPMSAAVYDEVLRFVTTPSDDPKTNARKRRMIQVLVDTTPEVRDELVDRGRREGRLAGERSALRRVLAARKLALSPGEEARIDACTDLETLLRWIDQAAVATSTADALR